MTAHDTPASPVGSSSPSLGKLPNPIQIPDLSRPPRDLDELVQLCRWLRWYYVFGKDGKPTKKPTGKWGNLIYWMSYAQATARIPLHGGIGFILSHDCDIGVVDLDDCLDNSVASPWAVPIVEAALDAELYVEWTVSGKGIRIIGRTEKPMEFGPDGRMEGYTRIRKEIGRPKAGYECYARSPSRLEGATSSWGGRYLTLSGRGYGKPRAPIDPIFDLIEQLYPATTPIQAVTKKLRMTRPPSAALRMTRPPSAAFAPSADHDWRVVPSRKPKTVDPEVMGRIVGPLSDHDARDRSAGFHGVVYQLFLTNFSIREIVALMQQHPNGVATRFIQENRLARMTELSFGKLRAQFEQQRARAACLLDWHRR